MCHAPLQVPDADDILLVDAFVPHMRHMLKLAVSYSQQATWAQAAAAGHSTSSSSSWPLHHSPAGTGSSWWGSSLTGPAPVTAHYTPLHEWRPLSPTRQGRYQRCFVQNDLSAQQWGAIASCPAGPGAPAGSVRASRGAAAPSLASHQVHQAAAGCQQLCHDVAAMLLQAVSVLVSQPR